MWHAVTGPQLHTPSCFLGCVTVQVNPGEVIHIFSDQEFEQILKNYPDQTIAVMASLTWCRPCIGFEKSYEVRLLVGYRSRIVSSARWLCFILWTCSSITCRDLLRCTRTSSSSSFMAIPMQ